MNKIVAINNEKVSIPTITENNEKFFQKPSEIKKYEEKKALDNLVKECIKEWCENTTSHGFSNMVRTDSWLIRITWIILVILFMGYCIFSVIIIIIDYLNYDTSIMYQIKFDSPAEFPAVTICNLNAFDVASDAMTESYIIKKLEENNIKAALEINGDEYGITLVEDTGIILKAAVVADKTLNTSTLKKLGFTMNTMMISCFYNNEKCNESDFTWFRDSEFGNCYTFNSLFDSNDKLVDSKKTSKTGPINGLNLELFIGAAGVQDYYTIKRGVKVVVHERGIKPLLKYQGIYVGTATAANIAVTKVNYSRLDLPYNDCRKDTNKILPSDSKYFNETIKISKYYQKMCYEICLQYSQIIPNCGCADPSIPSADANQTICNNKTTLLCVKTQRDLFDKQNIDEICGQYCPVECYSVTYTTSVSSSKYPTSYYSKLLMSQKNINVKFNPPNIFSPSTSPSTHPSSPSNVVQKKPGMSEIENAILMLSVFYEDLKYTYIEEIPAITFETLMGVIGGQFGLFMGASFLSFVEILEMIVNLIRILLKYRNKKKNLKNNFK